MTQPWLYFAVDVDGCILANSTRETCGLECESDFAEYFIRYYRDVRIVTAFDDTRECRSVLENDAYTIPIFAEEVPPGFTVLRYIVCN